MVYGCHSNNGRDVRAAGYWAPDGYQIISGKVGSGPRTVQRVMRWIPDVMSTDCRYDLSATDRRCHGCKKCTK